MNAIDVAEDEEHYEIRGITVCKVLFGKIAVRLCKLFLSLAALWLRSFLQFGHEKYKIKHKSSLAHFHCFCSGVNELSLSKPALVSLA